MQNTFFQDAVDRYEKLINQQFKEEGSLVEKINKVQMKIEMCAFKIYEVELAKGNQKTIDRKAQEMADLTKEKLSL